MAPKTRVPTDEAVTLLEFSLSDPSYPFVEISSVGRKATLEELIPRKEGRYSEYFTVTGVDPEDVLTFAAEYDALEAKLLEEREDTSLFEFVVDASCPAVCLGEQGALPRRVESTDGEGHIEAEVPASEDASAIVEDFLDAHPSAELVRKRTQPYTTPMFGHREFQDTVEEHLTECQQEALAAAHEAGYYNIPREGDGMEIADELDICSSTLHQHLRVAEQKLVTLFFERPSTGTTAERDEQSGDDTDVRHSN